MPSETASPAAMLASFAAGPEQLEAALAGLPAAGLDCSLAPESWTIRQLVHHLADGEGMWLVCIKMAIGAPGSAFAAEWYPGNDAWAAKLGYATLPTEVAVTLFRAQRLYISQLLTQQPAALAQQVIMSGHPMPVGAIIGMLTAHVAEHVAEIGKIRQQNNL
jgi:DinB superfamily